MEQLIKKIQKLREWEHLGLITTTGNTSDKGLNEFLLELENEALRQPLVSVSVLSDEEMREPIEDALYATGRFLTTQATDLAEGIIDYIKDSGYIIVRTDR